MISRVRSWSSLSRARSFFALSDGGWYSASSAGLRRLVIVLPPILRVHSAYGPRRRGGSGRRGSGSSACRRRRRGVAAGGGVRPAGDRGDGTRGEGAGEEPAVGGGQAGRLRHRAGAGPGAGGAAAPVGGRAVHLLRARAVRCGTPHAAHQPEVRRPPGRAAAISAGSGAAAGARRPTARRR